MLHSFGLISLLPTAHASASHVHQAQRKADSLHQSLSALGDKVKQQTAPNKDIQKEIADMTEVNVVFVLQRLQNVTEEQVCWCCGINTSVLSAVDRHSSDLPVAEG